MHLLLSKCTLPRAHRVFWCMLASKIYSKQKHQPALERMMERMIACLATRTHANEIFAKLFALNLKNKGNGK